MAEDCLNLAKDRDLPIQEAGQILNMINSKKSTLRPRIIKLLNTKDKENNNREK